jgi:predicted glycosyltransferase
MKIVVDINHPAHVHYFKNFIWEMEKKGHEVLITATEKDVALKLLDNYDFNYAKMGGYGSSLIKKLMNIPIMDLKMYKAVKSFKPDIFVGFGSIRAAHISFLLRRKCINFEDTEHSMEQIRLYLPFVNAVCSPSCFRKDLGHKQVRFNGYMELAHLHPNYFTPNPAVLDEMGLSKGDTFIILRFVSWSASHDVGHSGLTLDTKRKAVKEFEKYGRVLITSESPLPKEFEKYRITVSSEKIHDLMYYATLLYGESATMASECAVLGTHAIFCDFAGRGYTDEEEEKYRLVFNFKLDEESQRNSLEKAVELLENNNLKSILEKKREKLLKDKIDVTAFMVWFVENYPESFKKIRKNSKVQEMFK